MSFKKILFYVNIYTQHLVMAKYTQFKKAMIENVII